MKIIFTNHAKQRMIERGIKLEEIRDMVNFPDYTITNEDKIEAHKNNLKIVYISKDKFIRIITVIRK